MIKTPTKPQLQPLSMLSRKVWAYILSEAAVMERPDSTIEKKTRHNKRIWMVEILFFDGQVLKWAKNIQVYEGCDPGCYF